MPTRTFNFGAKPSNRRLMWCVRSSIYLVGKWCVQWFGCLSNSYYQNWAMLVKKTPLRNKEVCVLYMHVYLDMLNQEMGMYANHGMYIFGRRHVLWVKPRAYISKSSPKKFCWAVNKMHEISLVTLSFRFQLSFFGIKAVQSQWWNPFRV